MLKDSEQLGSSKTLKAFLKRLLEKAFKQLLGKLLKCLKIGF